ncbi:Putative motility protein [Anaerobranca californiensis DSM 14826]|jgi:hypothetical protein|uniref:Putative motility protein n=1 Tax=Anaerobranca californiensis DSM 14826 TaxID=1120989 RepID=A0A1M6S4V2_9FIRM|nr:YjfB family protein [Anaerobranca californiensis]SHK39701.1 Putative motility protein [Anaerobranca californiensis DSM 14826]
MDIAALSMNLNQAKVAQETSLAIMKLAMGTGKQTANETVKIIEKSVDSNLGRIIDVSVRNYG